MKKILQQLIAIPSISGQEKEIQAYIFDFLQAIQVCPKYVGENVVCNIPGKDRKKTIIFNGHVDTVSYGNKELWKYDPFVGKIVNNTLYGLGASDMKSGIAVMLSLAQLYSQVQPECDIWLHFVVQEETTGKGTQDVMKWWVPIYKKLYTSIAGIIAEPTDLKKIEIAHKGNIFLKVTTYGDSGHGSEPHKIQHHAVVEMYKIAEKLQKLIKKWSKKYKNPLLGVPTMSPFTSIIAGEGTSPNKIADSCVATFDIRYTPALDRKIFPMLKKALANKSTTIDIVYDPLPSGYTNPQERIVQIAQQVSGIPIGATPGATDLLFFTQYAIPGIILGPGCKSVEHQINEYCTVDSLEKCLNIYKKIIQNF